MRRIPRRRGALAGLLIVVLGAFAALIPFVGPYFDFQIGTQDTWDWSLDRFWLSVLPGAVAALGGLILMGSFRRASASLGGLLALAGGLWLIAGPTVSMAWNGGDVAAGAAFGDTGTRVLEWLGFFYGVGGLITLLAAYELGFMAALPIHGEAVTSREAAAADTEAERAPAERAGAIPTRRRRFLRRPSGRRETARR
jgi:hypothetical protein